MNEGKSIFSQLIGFLPDRNFRRCVARDNNLLDPVEAARILTVPGVPTRGVRLGNWLTPREAKRLLAVPDRGSLIGKRAFAILNVLMYCVLRREELARLEMRHIQKREGRWVIADLAGKRGRVRTVPIPSAARVARDPGECGRGR